MYEKDTRDIIAGVILLAVGMFSAGYSMIQLDLGTFGRMGPGMFPMLVGICMFLLGVTVAVPALFRAQDERMQVDLKAAIFVLGAVLSFSLVLPVFGLVPGIVVLTVVGSFADGKLSILSALLLSVALVLIGYAVFVFALSIQVDNFSWPW